MMRSRGALPTSHLMSRVTQASFPGAAGPMRVWIAFRGSEVWFDLASLGPLLVPERVAAKMAAACDLASIHVYACFRITGGLGVPQPAYGLRPRVERDLRQRIIQGADEASTYPVILSKDVPRLAAHMKFADMPGLGRWLARIAADRDGGWQASARGAIFA